MDYLNWYFVCFVFSKSNIYSIKIVKLWCQYPLRNKTDYLMLMKSLKTSWMTNKNKLDPIVNWIVLTIVIE